MGPSHGQRELGDNTMDSRIYQKHGARQYHNVDNHDSFLENELKDNFASMNNRMTHSFDDLEKKMEETMSQSIKKMNEKIDSLGKGDHEASSGPKIVSKMTSTVSGETKTVIGPDGKKVT